MSEKRQQLRELYENDLYEFAKYINPHYCYGEVHEKVFKWMSDQDCSDHQLMLLPRAHLKSHCIAVWAVWQITRDPTTTMVYLSAMEELATIQVSAIKAMFLSDRYQLLWPEMINKEEAKRDKWSAWAFNVDHPKRKAEGIRDYTIIVKTVKSNAIGLHCSHLVLDDVVTDKNAYTEIGRQEVAQAIAQFASIKNPGAYTKAVGTRYHPADLYNMFAEAMEPVFDEEGQHIGEEPLWDILEYKTEDIGDGTGVFLWPRELSPVTSKWYGFDPKILARIRAQYFSMGQQAQFYAQYYNDPNDPGSETVDRKNFQYYNAKYLKDEGGGWHYNGRKLSIFAAMDVAWTDVTNSKLRRDYTAIAVIGLDSDGMIYVLDLERFQTDKFDVYYEKVLSLYRKWGFRKIYIETNAAGHFIEKELKNYIRQNGDSLVVEGRAATRHEGKKEEKHAMITYPRYEMKTVWHGKGGLFSILEEEITLKRPPHDDLLDALTTAISVSKPPSVKRESFTDATQNIVYHPRFGGRRGR
jgi:hypothetical protein